MIRLDNVTKTYPGGVQAVSDLSLQIGQGETLVLVGTSGSGKTTALKMINRLIEPSSGNIYVENKSVHEWDEIELRRHIGYVIQSVGLFPHMTVAENVSVVLRLLGWHWLDVQTRVAEVLTMVGLEQDDYARRYPSELSGGQQQRVGVARALTADPPIILMDEPFGALDPITRFSLQQEFLDLKRRIRKTIVFVTHDISEAVILGDRIAVMRFGRLEQVASPEELITKPATSFVSDFLGRQRFQLRLDTVKSGDVSDTSPRAIEYAQTHQMKPIKADAPLGAALAVLADLRESAVSVVDEDGKTVGILTKKAMFSVVQDLLNGDPQ